MANARDLIRTNTGPQSGLVFDNNFAESHFAPKGWSKTTNTSMQKLSYKPANASLDGFGSTLEWRPPKNIDFLGFPVVQIPFSTITPGTGGTFARLMDYAGPGAINNITISHVSNLLTKFDGQLYVPLYLKNRDERCKHQWDPLLLGNLSPTSRNILGQAPQVAQVPLDGLFWFTYATSCFVPLIILSHELRVEITFNTLGQVLESDHTGGTPACTISTQSIRGVSYPLSMIFLGSHVTGDERVWQTSLYENDGVMTAFKQYKAQPRETILANTQGVVSVHLTSIKDQISEIFWVIRKQSDASNNFTADRNRRLSYVSFSFTGNGGEMIANHTKEYVDRRLREQFHSSRTGQLDNIGFYSPAWTPEDPVNNTGSFHMGIISDPTLNLDFGSAAGQSDAYDCLNGTGSEGVAENVVIDVYVEAFNWLHYVGGDINKIFN